MEKNQHLLIIVDAVVNLVIGAVLLLSPWGALRFLGLPQSDSLFYPMILGAVIFGIGLALLLEAGSSKDHRQGLGIKGAIAINLCGSGMLLAWLIFFPVTLPFKGILLLWIVAISVLLLGIIELVSGRLKKSR